MKLTKSKLKEIIHEELLNEASWLPSEFRKGLPKGLIQKVSKALKWDIALTFAFVVGLLEDVNAHPEAKKVNAILDKELDKFNK